MRILIIEPECNGHHIITYIRFILRLLLSHKIEVIIITSSKSKNHFSLKTIKKIYPRIKIKFIKYSKPKNYSSFFLLLNQINLYFLIKKTFTEITANYRIDKVFINSIDHFDKALSIFGDPFKKTPFFGMYTLPKFHFSFLQKLVQLLAPKHLHHVLCYSRRFFQTFSQWCCFHLTLHSF